jgi:hypothetical protein
VCTINVNNGVVELLGPGDEFCFHLEDASIRRTRARRSCAFGESLVAQVEQALTVLPASPVHPF